MRNRAYESPVAAGYREYPPPADLRDRVACRALTGPTPSGLLAGWNAEVGRWLELE